MNVIDHEKNRRVKWGFPRKGEEGKVRMQGRKEKDPALCMIIICYKIHTMIKGIVYQGAKRREADVKRSRSFAPELPLSLNNCK